MTKQNDYRLTPIHPNVYSAPVEYGYYQSIMYRNYAKLLSLLCKHVCVFFCFARFSIQSISVP